MIYCVNGHRMGRRRDDAGRPICVVCALMTMTSRDVRVEEVRRNHGDPADCDDSPSSSRRSSNEWDFELQDGDHDPAGFTDSPASSEIEHGQASWTMRNADDQRGIEGVLRDRRRREQVFIRYPGRAKNAFPEMLDVVRAELVSRSDFSGSVGEQAEGAAADMRIGHTSRDHPYASLFANAYDPWTGKPSCTYLTGEDLFTEISRNDEEPLIITRMPRHVDDAVDVTHFPVFFHRYDVARATHYEPIVINAAGAYNISLAHNEWVLQGVASDNPEHGNDPRIYGHLVMMHARRT